MDVSVINNPVVLIANNPLKQIKFSATYLAENGHILSQFKEVQKEWPVSVVPHYMELTKGVWNIALDSYVYKIKSPAQVDTVFEVSTSLVTSYETVAVQNRYRPYRTKLGTIHVFGNQGNATFGPLDPKWFTIERTDTTFQLGVSQHPMSILPAPRLEIDFEITILFQRIK